MQVTDHHQREREEGRNIEDQSNCETEEWPRQQDFSWCLSNQAVTKRSDLEFGEIAFFYLESPVATQDFGRGLDPTSSQCSDH